MGLMFYFHRYVALHLVTIVEVILVDPEKDEHSTEKQNNQVRNVEDVVTIETPHVE